MGYFISQRYLTKAMLIVFLLISCSGCSPKKYQDVSLQNEYKNVIGTQFALKTDLLAVGVTFDANYKKVIDYVFIMEEPGTSGPQVVFSETLKKGNQFRIVGVLEDGGIFSDRIFYVLSFKTKRYSDEIVIVRVFDSISTPSKGLDSQLFRRL